MSWETFWQLFGALLLWVMGTVAIAEWFAIQKLNTALDEAESERDALLSDTARMIREYKSEQ